MEKYGKQNKIHTGLTEAFESPITYYYVDGDDKEAPLEW